MARGFNGFTPRDPVTLPGYSGTLVVSSATTPVLPDLTQYTYPPTILAPSNAAAVPSTVKTVDGWSVTTGFSAGTLGQIAPLAAPTPRGVWGAATITPPTLGTIAGGAALTVNGSVMVDPTNGIAAILYNDGTNFYLACVNVNTGAVTASPLNMFAFNASNFACIYAISTTVILVGGQHAGTNYTFATATLTPTTLALAAGLSATTGTALFDTPVQCSSQYYAFLQNNAGGAVRGVFVSGVTVTIGTAQTTGSYSETTSGTSKLAKITGASPGVGQCYLAFLAIGGGSNSRELAAATVTVASSTAAVTVSTSINMGGQNNSQNASLKAFVPGVSNSANALVVYATSGINNSFVYLTANYGTPGSATFTARTDRTETQISAVTNYGSWIYKKTGVVYGVYSSGGNDYVALGQLSSGIYALGPLNSASAPASGSTLSYAAAKTFLTDAAGNGSLWACSSGLTDLIGTSGTTLSTATSLAVTSTVVKDLTFNEKSAYYKGVWYALTMPTVQAILSPSVWVLGVGNNLIVCGPVK